MKREGFLTESQKVHQRKVIQKLLAAKGKQPITSLPFKNIAFKAFDTRAKKQNYYYIEFQNRRRWEGHLFAKEEILRKSEQTYFSKILKAIEEFEANFDQKQNTTTCKNIRRCLRIHLHRVERLKIPTYEEIYQELGLVFWVHQRGRKRGAHRKENITVGPESLGESSEQEEGSSELKSDEDSKEASPFANIGMMKDYFFKESKQSKENKPCRVVEIDQYVKKMDQDFQKIEKMLQSSQKDGLEPRQEGGWEIQVSGVFKTKTNNIMMIQEDKNGDKKLEEWNEKGDPKVNKAMLDYLLEHSKVPQIGRTISF